MFGVGGIMDWLEVIGVVIRLGVMGFEGLMGVNGVSLGGGGFVGGGMLVLLLGVF